MKKIIVSLLLLLVFTRACTQTDRWQQRINYVINVEMDVVANPFLEQKKEITGIILRI